ncbi:hypothetical protein [Salinilacihabitans rarus]|uniref:hypothetical protein n=1 Tax=Salinilacihabitans rarus TaxID=2961596 RepID=UPI0020C83916|nr:hypothetical protein [Salinilacihabitans rarus]
MSKLVLAAFSTVFVLYLLALLPGIDRLLPETRVSVAALASAVATFAVVALLWYLASGLAALVRTLLAPRDLAANVASIVHWVVVLVAVLVAHRGLAPAVVPLLGEAAWAYDVAFLLVALAPLSFVAAVLYVTLDPAADLIAGRVAGEQSAEANGGSASTDGRDDDSRRRIDVGPERPASNTQSNSDDETADGGDDADDAVGDGVAGTGDKAGGDESAEPSDDPADETDER